jgi:quercetin dioxygenase-like cupin family protein
MKTAGHIAVATLIVTGISLIVGAAMALTPTQPEGIRRIDLLKNDLSAPGREVVQARVEIDPGVTSPKHWHPGEELVYVIEGTLEYQVEGKPPVTLKAGDVLYIPAGAVHLAKNVGKDNGAELATYFVEKGKPLSTIVK